MSLRCEIYHEWIRQYQAPRVSIFWLGRGTDGLYPKKISLNYPEDTRNIED